MRRGDAIAEWVPNLSLGRAPDLLAELVERIGAAGAWVLDHSADADHNRAVVTCAGPLDALVEAAVRTVAFAVEHIDLRAQAGCHPRIGACDVCPFVPLEGVVPDGADVRSCVDLARAVGVRVGRDLSVPVYYYGAASPSGRTLPEVRRDVEGLTPDEGPPRPHPTAGSVAVGVRPFLIAFNVNLDADDLDAARSIARAIRESSGGLPGVRALAFALEHAGRSQVSMNVCDHERTGLIEVFTRIESLAREHGATVRESELIGLAPRAALDESIARRVRLVGFDPDRHVLENVLAARRATRP